MLPPGLVALQPIGGQRMSEMVGFVQRVTRVRLATTVSGRSLEFDFMRSGGSACGRPQAFE